jgi:hypothetical protein
MHGEWGDRLTASMPTPISAPPSKPGWFLKWHRRVLGFCLVVFAFELGLFLLIFPWNSRWDLSWVPLHSQRFADIWMSRYFRGALSGLGLLNIYVAIGEAVKQLKSIFGRNQDS